MPRGVPRTPVQAGASGASSYTAAPSGAVSTDELEVGQSPERVLRSTGDAQDSLDGQGLVKVMEQPYDDEKMAMLAFMNEEIEIELATNSDPNAEQIFEININNRPFLFRRGERKVVPRYVADRLARMKVTRYVHREAINSEGIKDVVYTPITSLKYSFMVTRDGNKHGQSWLRAVISEPG